ncbi:hypothetical protein BROUX41_002576 [Berkeleyomyces rouxiae]|uniref:uncharacterized protein n=1 Tax=Berkeleyomyces rouxiae TaxID=2035830 RepID=UPI003B793FC1
MPDSHRNMLQALEEQVDVDVDWMDPDFIRLNSFKFHDMTSNQFIVDAQIDRPENKVLIEQAASELGDKDWLAVYTRVAATLCKNNLPFLSGRVLLQTRPADAYDTTATLKYAHLIDAEFARLGVSRDRYAIKIPITGPAMNAARTLQAEGIMTLGTTLLSVEQALAASQAGCYYVSPYLNEIKAHVEHTVWPAVADPAAEHPMAPRVAQMLRAYRKLYHLTGTEQPRVKLASLLSTAECMAAGELRCHGITIAMPLLIELSATPAPPDMPRNVKPKHPYAMIEEEALPKRLAGLLVRDPLREGWDGQVAGADVDYLADGGRPLDEAFEMDVEAKKRLVYALNFFDEAERRSKAVIEKVLSTK